MCNQASSNSSSLSLCTVCTVISNNHCGITPAQVHPFPVRCFHKKTAAGKRHLQPSSMPHRLVPEEPFKTSTTPAIHHPLWQMGHWPSKPSAPQHSPPLIFVIEPQHSPLWVLGLLRTFTTTVFCENFFFQILLFLAIASLNHTLRTALKHLKLRILKNIAKELPLKLVLVNIMVKVRARIDRVVIVIVIVNVRE